MKQNSRFNRIIGLILMTILAVFIFANIAGCSNLSRFDSYDMKDIMLAQLDKPRGAVTDEDFLQLKDLSINFISSGRARVVNFAYINKAANIEKLDLYRCHIDDLSPLNSLQKLNRMIIGECEIDFSQLRHATRLKALSIFDSNMSDSDIVYLAQLRELEYLSLCDSELTSIDPFSQLVKLRCLLISNNKISDISVLLDLPNLEIVDMANNPLNDNSVNVVIPKLKANGVKVSFHKS